MKIGLGTAQFGLDYGISNRTGQVDAGAARRILTLAEDAGVQVVDTAAAYGDAEVRLGRWLRHDHPFSIVTKLPRPPAEWPRSEAAGWALDTFARSLERLRAARVYGWLIHSAHDLLGRMGDELWRALETAKRDGSVQKIGVSVYAADEIDETLARYPIDLIQVPVSILDQRLVRSGHLVRLKAAGVEVHARSILLQGLMLMDPDTLQEQDLEPARGTIAAFQSAAVAIGRSPLQAAIAYVAALPEVETMIVGVTDERQFAEVIAAAAMPALPSDWSAAFALDDERILDPSRWR